MNRVVVVGGGGHARVLISSLKKMGWIVLGFTDQEKRASVLGVPYLGTDIVLPGLLREEGARAVLGIGKVDRTSARLSLLHDLKVMGFELPMIVSPGSTVNEEVDLGEGTFVADGAVVNSGTTVGVACILNTNCTVDHDCWLGDNVHIAPGATVSGGVTVGDNSMVGAGATVIHGVTICPDVMIGAGSTVVTDIRDPGVYVGTPARCIS